MISALKYTELLEEAGFSPEQAKASVKIWTDLMNDNFATKSDIKLLSQRMDFQFKEVESKITIRLGTIMAIGIGLIATLIQLK